ncbi:MAG: TadE family protein [Candidatus Dormibacter sp.]
MIGRPLRTRKRGQALIETAIVIAVLLSLLMGVYATSQFASDQNTAGTATRSGARLGAELGNNSYNAGGGAVGCQLGANGGSGLSNDPCDVDRQIVQVVCRVAAAMPFVSSIDEIDIYRPGANSDGTRGGTDLYDKYTSCTPGVSAAVTQYTLDLRKQVHPNEAFIGVSLKYSYKSPAPIIPLNAQPTVYTVVQLSPHFT